VGILVGSLRRQSLSRKMAQVMVAMAPASLEMEIVEIGHLPLCNTDDEEDPPATIVVFKRKVESLDAVLFVTPEYNRGVPGVLKNAIDVASRPYGENSWQGKAAAVMSVSPGAMGAFGANHQLRQSLVFLDMPTMQQPEAYVGNAASLFDEQGAIAHEDSRKFVADFLAAFVGWVQRQCGPRS
jgi:chromate reductase, NAD(P)H dehydrogenase (quinone)